MTVLHSISAFAGGGLDGIQAVQRDWSPYLAHFTSYRAMLRFQRAISQGTRPKNLAQSLAAADQDSWKVVRQIGSAAQLRASSPTGKDDVADCVCLSESTLPGLLSMSERYGRFGFVFEKKAVFAVGGRPCVYVDRDIHVRIRQVARASGATPQDRRLSWLANRYSPPGTGGPVQDFTHEREWRVFDNLDLASTPPTLYLCPSDYLQRMRSLFDASAVYLPLDLAFRWGS